MKLTVILERTMVEDETAYEEFKQVEVEIPDDGYGKWHVVGEAVKEADYAGN